MSGPVDPQRPIAVLGAGAFGTALAIALAGSGRQAALWGRGGARMDEVMARRENASHLPGLRFPDALLVTDDISRLPRDAVVLLAVPAQSLRGVLIQYRDHLRDRFLVACCKGIETGTGLLPSRVIADVLPDAPVGVLTGPGFAADIAMGKPTALTLATNSRAGEALQALLSTHSLRLYLSDDPTGAELGGALKNVVAIAAGIAIGAGLGDSARAALMTRGFAEMVRFAVIQGARRETLFGLSGFGDLVLTCTSAQSRNLRLGLSIGAGQKIDPTATVEGVMTAHALAETATEADLPISRMVSAVLRQQISLETAIDALLSRPLKREIELY